MPLRNHKKCLGDIFCAKQRPEFEPGEAGVEAAKLLSEMNLPSFARGTHSKIPRALNGQSPVQAVSNILGAFSSRKRYPNKPLGKRGISLGRAASCPVHSGPPRAVFSKGKNIALRFKSPTPMRAGASAFFLASLGKRGI